MLRVLYVADLYSLDCLIPLATWNVQSGNIYSFSADSPYSYSLSGLLAG